MKIVCKRRSTRRLKRPWMETAVEFDAEGKAIVRKDVGRRLVKELSGLIVEDKPKAKKAPARAEEAGKPAKDSDGGKTTAISTRASRRRSAGSADREGVTNHDDAAD